MVQDGVIDKVEIEHQKNIIRQISQINQTRPYPPLAYLVTYGCQQNENDTQRLRGQLNEMGFSFTDNKEEADLIIFNTCAVRESAELKVYGNIGALVHLKRRKPSLLIALCGCMMQQEHVVKDIKRKYRHVDMVFGTHTLHRFPEILLGAMKSGERIFDVIDSDGAIAEDMPILREEKYKAWVSIMYGCNNFCSYCIVPYVRGRERSRKPEAIIDEITSLVSDGVKDITLLGQNVNSYGRDLESGIDFADLLVMANEVKGDFRLRFITSHPKDATPRLFDAMARCDKVVKHLHLPFQAGNDRVLKLMNRNYTKEKYLSLIADAKKKMPDIVFTSDVIVGFPTETYDEFLDTIDIIKKVEFDSLFTFLYSRRKGTPAYSMEGQIEKEEKLKRFQELLDVQNEISRRINDSYVGNTYRVLCEGESKTDQKIMSGRTDTNKIVNFKCPQSLIGQFVNVTITKAQTWSLFGILND